MTKQTAIITTSNKRQTFDVKAIDRADLQPTTKYKYKRELQAMNDAGINPLDYDALTTYADGLKSSRKTFLKSALRMISTDYERCLLYTSPSPRDRTRSRMPSSA